MVIIVAELKLNKKTNIIKSISLTTAYLHYALKIFFPISRLSGELFNFSKNEFFSVKL